MRLLAAFFALSSLVVAAPSNPMCQVPSNAALENITSVLGPVTTVRCLLNDYENLSDSFKQAVSLELKPKAEGGIVFGDDFIWNDSPSDWFSRIARFESYRRLYSNATTSEVPPGVAKYILGDALNGASNLVPRTLLVPRARQCDNGSPGCCCVCSRTEGDNRSRTSYCANAYGGTPQRCGCGNGKNCIQGVRESNTYGVAYCSTSSPADACFQCTGRGCSCG